MGRLFQVRLPTSQKLFACASCGVHLARRDELVSKAFHGKTGPALLLDAAVNLDLSPPVARELMTGVHTVADAFCAVCGAALGWTYLAARPVSQRYKVGKFVLERAQIRKVKPRPAPAAAPGERVEVEGGAAGLPDGPPAPTG
jgi:hypothetical protein